MENKLNINKIFKPYKPCKPYKACKPFILFFSLLLISNFALADNIKIAKTSLPKNIPTIKEKVINNNKSSIQSNNKPIAKKQLSANNKTKKLPITINNFTLKNGLQVIHIPNHRAPVVNHTIWYKAGSADSPYNKSGLAHFVEHLMFKGTTKYPLEEYKKIINKLGAVQNAYTYYDTTMYYVTVAKEYLDNIMELESDRMQNLVFTEKVIEKERSVVLQERRERIESNPIHKIAEAANATFFWLHPYGMPNIGYKHHIESYTLNDAKNFYNTWYCPNNAILVITGDIDLNTVKLLTHKYYEKIPQKILPKRDRPIEPEHHNVKGKLQISDPQINNVFLQRIYDAPNARTTNIKTALSLHVLAHILGDSTSGRLHKSFVEQFGIAHQITASFNGTFRDPYSFTISATPVNQSDLTFLETAIEYEILKLIKNGVTKEELRNSKNEIQYSFRYENDSLTSISEYIGLNLANGISLEDILSWLDIIENITLSDISKVANDYLKIGPRITVYTYPISYN